MMNPATGRLAILATVAFAISTITSKNLQVAINLSGIYKTLKCTVLSAIDITLPKKM